MHLEVIMLRITSMQLFSFDVLTFTGLSPELLLLIVCVQFGLKSHLHKQLFCNTIRRFFMRENLSRIVVAYSRLDSLAAIAFSKNRRHVSNTFDLRHRLYFARLDARIVLARNHLHEVDFNVSRVRWQSRARVNSKPYAIYESPRHSAMHKCFESRWLRLS